VAQLVERGDEVFEAFLLAAKVGGALGVAPDRGILAQAGDFLETLAFRVEVKDTSGARRNDR
jgi:hypothetical protein